MNDIIKLPKEYIVFDRDNVNHVCSITEKRLLQAIQMKVGGFRDRNGMQQLCVIVTASSKPEKK